MALLANPITLTYNGITFGTAQEVSASKRFVLDTAGRTVTHTVLSLRVKDKIVAGAAQNATLAAIRSALERPGGQLVYAGTAFGGLTVNTAADDRDLAWGPIPRVLTWRPVGRDQAAEIEWQVEIALLGCDGAPTTGAVMEANYNVTYSTDNAGYTTRTWTGFIRIPMTRVAVANAAVPDTADNYVDRFIPPPIPRFERTSTRTLDESKCKCTFTITDTERPGNALPPGIVNATASHTLSSESGKLMNTWTGTVSGSFEVDRGLPRFVTAWNAFFAMLTDRVREHNRAGRFFLPLSATMTEPEIYGSQAATFAYTYALTDPNARGNVQARQIGFWPFEALGRPVPGTDWDRWTQSMAISQNLRGHAGIRHPANHDIIVDLCLNRRPNQNAVNGQRMPEPPGVVQDKWAQLRRELKIDDHPNPLGTWIIYRQEVIVEEESHMTAHFPLPTTPGFTESRLKTPALSEFRQGSSAGYSSLFSVQRSPAPVVQHRMSPGYYVRLVGRALRVAYPIPRPDIVRVAGSPVYDANDPALGTFWAQSLASWTTHPIYTARWNLRYFVARGAGAGNAPLEHYPHPFGGN